MIYLASTSDKLQVVTSSANAVHVHVSYVDLSGSTVTPDRADASIAAATTTDVVTSPGAATTRKIKFLSVFNDHASAAQNITIRHTDGTTTVDLWAASVPAQSGVIFDEKCGWRVMRAEAPSDIQTFDAPGGIWVKPTSFTPSVVLVRLWGGGGGGGGGASLATAVVAKGGAGGGGAPCITKMFYADEIPETTLVFIGYGGPGGLGAVAGTAGSGGSSGQNSVLIMNGRQVLISYGGRGGTGGQNTGGSATTGGIGTGGHDAGGALSAVGYSVIPINGASTAVNGPNWEGGGGGGGVNNSSTVPTVFAGGNARWGGGGGGAGGCHSNVPAIINASAGGGTGNGVGTSAGGLGGAAGTSGATPTAGDNGTDTAGIAGGTGGGGGGTTITASTAGANGGNGGKGGGGGGGGGCGMDPGVGGNGGNGGNGYGVIMTW